MATQKTSLPNPSAEATTISVEKKPVRTPAYAAMHAARYRRQELIRTIDEKARTQLICYVGGLRTLVSRDDVVYMADLLHTLAPEKDVDLLLHTPGGDMDVAEKLVSMLRDRVGSARLRVVVPDFAKSAGTLMVLGADRVVMSDSSELGPIDPQVVTEDEQGSMVTPIQSYLDAYEACAESVNSRPSDVAARIMFEKFDPTKVQHFKAAMGRARKLAENLLVKGMFRAPNVGNYTQVTTNLLDTKRWQSHSQMIGHADAHDLGLFVDYLPPDAPLWQLYWQLYCSQRIEIHEKHKLFESNYVSLCVEEGAPS